MHVKYLITDYDDTAYSYTSARSDHLSQPIIDMALNGQYAGFYGCTHRSYSTISLLKLRTLRSIFSSLDSAIKNFATYRITENFSKATSLPVQAVSTVDDALEANRVHGTGYGYETLLRPYEKNRKIADADVPYMGKRAATRYPANKNIQLQQVAQHAAQAHPDCTIELDLVDDNRQICINALNVMEQAGWPENVFLNIYHYQNNTVELLQKAEIFYDADETCCEEISPLRENSLFSRQSSTPDMTLSPIPSLS